MDSAADSGRDPFAEASKVAGHANAAAAGVVNSLGDALAPMFGPESPAKPAFEAVRVSFNNFLEATGSPVRVQPVESLAVPAAAPAARPHLSTWTGRSPVPKEEVEAYVDSVLSHPDSIVNNPWVPDALEKQIYAVVVQLVLQMVHFAVGVADQRTLFGEMLRLHQSRGEHALRLVECPVTLDMVDRLVDDIDVAGDGAIITQSVDRALYQNVARFALRLVVDAASSLRISVFGLTFTVRAETNAASLAERQHRASLDVSALEAACEPLVRQMLADDDVNIAMVPDATEEKIYRTVLKLVANVLAAAVDAAEVEVCGIKVDPDLE